MLYVYSTVTGGASVYPPFRKLFAVSECIMVTFVVLRASMGMRTTGAGNGKQTDGADITDMEKLTTLYS
jgi:hypothetical protein